MESRRITVLGGLILVVLTVIAGVVVYGIMERQTESILSTSLKLSLKSRASLFESKLRTRLHGVVTVATRPFLVQQIKRIAADPGDAKAKFFLQRGVDSFLKTGFSALAIQDAQGRRVVSAGRFVEDPSVRVPIKLQVPGELLWSGGLMLASRIALRDKGKVVGYVRAQAKLPSLTSMMFDVTSLGKTGELALCSSLTAKTIQCFPSALHPMLFKPMPRTILGHRLPMDHALSGHSGVIRTDDYRGKDVVAAYMPLASSGLGMVLKVDQDELFRPAQRQLLYVLPTIGLSVLLGILMLRWLVTPLVGRVVASEHETREANHRLADREARLRAIFDNVDDGIMLLDEAGTVQSVNPGAQRIFGYSAEEMIGQSVSLFAPEYKRRDVEAGVKRDIQAAGSAVIGSTTEVTAVDKNGSSFPLELRVTEMCLDDERLFIGIMRDITERKEADARIVYLATHDTLTGLPNRHLLHDRVEQAIAHAERHEGVRVALLFIDLDGFKQVNDVHGHEMGDRVLVEAALRIRGALRNEDTVARQGGDEFIVALPNITEPEGAAVVAQKLLDILAVPLSFGAVELPIRASIGIALYPDDGEDMETLLKHSDTAMYAAKMDGHGAYRCYETEMGFRAEG